MGSTKVEVGSEKRVSVCGVEGEGGGRENVKQSSKQKVLVSRI